MYVEFNEGVHTHERLKALTASGALETDLSSKLSICSLVCGVYLQQ